MGQGGGMVERTRWHFPTAEEAIEIFREFGYWDEEEDPVIEDIDVLKNIASIILDKYDDVFGCRVEMSVDHEGKSCVAFRRSNGVALVESHGSSECESYPCLWCVTVDLIDRIRKRVALLAMDFDWTAFNLLKFDESTMNYAEPAIRAFRDDLRRHGGIASVYGVSVPVDLLSNDKKLFDMSWKREQSLLGAARNVIRAWYEFRSVHSHEVEKLAVELREKRREKFYVNSFSERNNRYCSLYPESWNVMALGLASEEPFKLVTMREVVGGDDGPYWGWESLESGKEWTMVWGSMVQLTMCFPGGVHARVREGFGRIVNLEIVDEL